MANQAQISEKNGSLEISGELNVASVMQVLSASLELLPKCSKLCFDFSKVTLCDSAGVGLMLQWMKYAKHNSKSIQFKNIPKQLESIIDVSGLKETIQDLIL